MVNRLQAQLIEKTLLAPDLYKIRFAVPEEVALEFKPGQFMSIAVDGYIRRSYSLSNPPSESKVLETYADVSPHGPGYKFFSESQVGIQANILAPLGNFVYQADKRPVYFFATGTGIVPFLSMIRHELEVVSSGREVNLLLGVRNEERLIWDQQMQELESKYTNFKYLPFISQPASGWQGRVGRVTDAISELPVTDVQAYICGGKVMIEDVEQQLLARGIAADQIFYERYY